MPETLRGNNEREQTPADIRRARVDRLRSIVFELFRGEEKHELRENIERSFLVPQVGDYHHEGMYMDSHLLRAHPLVPRNVKKILELAANDPQNLKSTFATKMRLLASALKHSEM